MKRIIPFVVLFLFAFTANCLPSGEANKEMAQLMMKKEKLIEKVEFLQNLAINIATELDVTNITASDIYVQAEKIVAEKSPEKFTKDEQLIVLYMAYFAERIMRLQAQLKLVEWEFNSTVREFQEINDRLRYLKNGRRA
jgi:hypothetical protein